MTSDKEHAPEVERALARQNASFAVTTEAELQHLVFMARCAADRLRPVPHAARDVLAALSLALETGNSGALEQLAKPALKQIAAAHVEAEELLESRETGGPFPVGFDPSQPQFRAHGAKTEIGRSLLEIASVYPRGPQRNDNQGESGRKLAEHFSNFVSLVAGFGPFADADRAELKARLVRLFPQGPTDDIEADAVGIGEALGMARKDARNAVDSAAKSSSV